MLIVGFKDIFVSPIFSIQKWNTQHLIYLGSSFSSLQNVCVSTHSFDCNLIVVW